MNTNISAWAIRTPLPSILLFVVLTIIGLYSFVRLPITYFPTVITPSVRVTIEQAGASPAELEIQVTRLVENAIASLPAIRRLDSMIDQGRSVTTVEFELGLVTPDRAVDDVRDAVSRIRSDLPATADEPLIERLEEDSTSLVTYAVLNPDMTVTELSWFIDDTVTRALQGLPGVGRIERVGGADREIHVELDVERLQALSLTAGTVNDMLLQTQLERSGGRSEVNGNEEVVTTAAAAETITELAGRRLALDGESSVRLSDIARVRDANAEPRAFAMLDGSEIAGFSVYRSGGAGEVAVATAVAGALEEIRTAYPDLQFRLVDDNVSYTVGNYHAAMSSLFEGAALSVIVVLLFLRDWRATIIAAVALPLSIIPTFFVIGQLGFSLNILSMLAITLVTGILVDDAIVEIENVVRHRNMGKSARRAALDASDEIGLAVIAISATIIAVFAPVGLMSGEVGLYFREFGLTVAIAVFFSLLVSRLIVPVLAAYFMTAGSPRDGESGRLMRAYEYLLKMSLRHPLLTVGAALGLFAIAIVSLASLPTAFLPEEDMGRLTLTVELPPGATLDDTRAATDDISDRLRGFEDVRGVFVRAGASMTGQEDVRHGIVLINLVHKSQRERSLSAIEADLERTLAAFPDLRLRFLNNRGSRDVSFALLGSDGDVVQAAANAILREMSADGDFVNPSSDNIAMRPELRVIVDTDRAAMLGVSPAMIAETIRVSTIGEVDSRLADFLDGSRKIPIRVIVDPVFRGNLPALRLLTLPAAGGGQVPLSAVAGIRFDETAAVINRMDRLRQIEMGTDMAAGMTSGQGLEKLMTLDSVRNLPDGMHIRTTGDSDSEGDVFESFVPAMGAGILLVLIVLILLFGSVLAPWTILASLPLSIAGVTLGLVLGGHAVSLPVVIGILMLMGIVTKNAIMLVDFAIEREAQGLGRMEAIVEACFSRIRPIVMTTLAMVGGMIPSAIGIGDGGEFRAPMAIAVIGGLLVSTLLSLIVIPSLHLIMSTLGERLSRIFRRAFQSAGG
ncbi:efflux RND transporter permease subunit (plasmid) [Tistrella mobilis]|uniref:efflux RND transporter permease subunit n=1 Tax=Tistrella mobilis TaxID=171437 RepID=UPI003557DE0B